LCVAAAQSPPAPAPAGSLLSAKDAASDAAFLKAALEEGHPDLYRFNPRADFDRVFARATARLRGAHPLTVAELYRLLAPVVTSIRCGHTRLLPPDALLSEIDRKTPWLPFDVEILDDRLWILRDYSSKNDEEPLAGAEILAINGRNAAALVATLTGVWSHDGDIETSRAWRMGHGRAFARFLGPAAGIAAPFTVKYRLKGAAQSAEFEGLARPAMLRLSRQRHPEDQKPETRGESTMLDDGKLAILTLAALNGATDEEPPRPIRALVADTFAQMEQRGTETLILDLRNNGGGDNELAKGIVAHLTPEPFDFYRSITMNKLDFSFAPYANPRDPIPMSAARQRDTDGRYDLYSHPNWGTQQPAKPYFAGRVFVIVNGGTFSSAAELASLLRARKRAVFIGEECGGGFDGNNSGYMPRVTLPHSKLVLQLPLVAFRLAVTAADGNPRRGVIPEHPVRYTIAELLAGTDKEMDLAISLARTGAQK
jgi:hypothetical protein